MRHAQKVSWPGEVRVGDVCRRIKNQSGGEAIALLRVMDLKDFVKWHPPALMYRSGEFNSSAKEIKPPVTYGQRA
jgi:hypothetical protein